MIKQISISNVILLLLFFLIKSKYIEGAIILPINTFIEEKYSSKNNEKTFTHSNIIKNFYFNTLYAIFEVGTPSQKVSLKINSQKKDYIIINSNPYNKIKDILSYYYFDESKSSTYKTEGCKKL